MARTDNAALVREMYEAFNRKDVERYTSYSAADARMTVVPFGVTITPRQHAETFASAFSDAHIEPTGFVAQGDWVVAEFTGRGTHDGTFRTPAGDLPPTSRRGELRFCELFRFRDGKIVEGRSYFDVLSLLRQLGIGAPAPAQRGAGAQQPHA
jgi:ketosteroid isomerase-like protein